VRGELDDALARLRRWDEVRQKLASGATSGADVEADPTPPPPPPPEPPAGPVPGPAVDEAVAAVGEVVRRYPRTAIVVTVRDQGTFWTAHLAIGADGQVEVTRAEPRDAGEAPQPTKPVAAESGIGPVGRGMSPPSGETPERAASRLADLIRRDPSLLDPPDETLR